MADRPIQNFMYVDIICVDLEELNGTIIGHNMKMPLLWHQFWMKVAYEPK